MSKTKSKQPIRRTPAQLRAREAKLLAELQAHHGYAFADALPVRDKSSMMADRVSGKLHLFSAIVLKVFVPSGGWMGRAVGRTRAHAAAVETKRKAERLAAKEGK